VTTRRKAQPPPAAPPASAPATFPEIGLTGLRYWSAQWARIDEEFLPELKWEKAQKIYREMGDNDPTVGAAFNAISWLIRQVPWRVEGDTETDPRVEFLETCRQDMSHSWEDFLAEAVRGTLQYGWQAHEIVYKRRVEGESQYTDGLIGWKKLPIRAQDTLFHWEFDPQDGGLIAMVQLPPPDWKERRLPIEKLLLFRTETFKGNPEGRSILRNAYRPWYMKKHLENIEGVGVERDLAGLPVLYAPARLFGPSASSDDAAVLTELQRIVTNIKRDEQEGVLMPNVYDEHGNQLYKLELLATAGQRQMPTSEIISRYDLRILQLMLADFLQVGHGQTGSFALASSKTELFAVANGVFLDQIASVFNRYAIPRLLELNGMETEDAPKLMHGDIEHRDVTELATALNTLAGSGMPLWPNPKIEAKVLEAMDLPVPTPEEQAMRDAEVQAEQQRQTDLMRQAQPDPAKPDPNAAPKAEAA